MREGPGDRMHIHIGSWFRRLRYEARRLFEPVPKIFYREKWDPLVSGAIALTLVMAFQVSRVVIDKRPLWPGSWVLAIGDWVAIPIFVTAAAALVRKLPKPAKPRIYHSAGWYGLVAIVAVLVNLLIEHQRSVGTELLSREQPPFSQSLHSLVIVPLLAMPVGGVVPHLIWDVKNKRSLAWVVAAISLGIYLGSLGLDLFQIAFQGRG